MDDEVFRALADPSRRTLLDRLFERDGQTLGELETALPGMTRFGMMKHLKVLESATLVTSRKVGRERHHYLNPVPIRRIHDRWLDRYRIRAADLLDDLRLSLETEPMTTPDAAAAGEARRTAHVFSTFIRATPEKIWQALTVRVHHPLLVRQHDPVRLGGRLAVRASGPRRQAGDRRQRPQADPPRRLVS